MAQSCSRTDQDCHVVGWYIGVCFATLSSTSFLVSGGFHQQPQDNRKCVAVEQAFTVPRVSTNVQGVARPSGRGGCVIVFDVGEEYSSSVRMLDRIDCGVSSVGLRTTVNICFCLSQNLFLPMHKAIGVVGGHSGLPTLFRQYVFDAFSFAPVPLADDMLSEGVNERLASSHTYHSTRVPNA
ncbi:hypothetical protein Efla_006551 [Eimeria flavescens]